MGMRMMVLMLGIGLGAGCERTHPRVEALREQHALLQEMVVVLRGINNEADMEKARVVLAEKYPRADQIARKLGSTLEPTGEARDVMQAEMMAMNRTMATMAAEGARVLKLPGGEKFMDSLKNLGDGQ